MEISIEAASNQLAALGDLLRDVQEAALAKATERPMTEIATLFSVRHCDQFTVGWLASVLGVTHSAAVRIADRLSGEGLLQRTPQANRRFVGLVLTEAGVAEADRLLAIRRQVLTDLFAGLEPLLLAAQPLAAALLQRHTTSELVSYQRCRFCDEALCGETCPVDRACQRLPSNGAS